MRVLIQRVKEASVKINKQEVGKIEQGYLLYLGIGKNDNEQIAQKVWEKIKKIRLFEDENQKTNLSLSDVAGEILLVSQFTLYASLKGANRPSFSAGASFQQANSLYEYFAKLIEKDLGKVEQGIFAADMQVFSINDGPFTIFLDSDTL